MSDYLKPFLWRYATKKFDAEKKIAGETLQILTEVLRLTPSSGGLQPWKFLFISNPEIKQKLKEKAWGQAQVSDCSHLVVLAAQTDLGLSRVNEYVQNLMRMRGISDREQVAGLHKMLSGIVTDLSPQELTSFAKKQTYIALGFLLTAAAQLKVDACPMEGFDPAGFDEILNLKEQNLTSSVICALGYRAEDDFLAKAEKVRFPADQIVEYIE